MTMILQVTHFLSVIAGLKSNHTGDAGITPRASNHNRGFPEWLR